MNKEVFISYKSEEFEEANWVKNVLETNGISCWMAPMCITGGSSYAQEIPQAIRNCKVFVLILSEKSQMSKWVPREVDQAINEGKIVMPFMLENCKLKDDFNFYLTNVQRYAAYESKVAAIEKMLREIKAILGPKEEPTVQVKPQPQPRPQPQPQPRPQPQPQPRPAQPQQVQQAKAQPKKANKKWIGVSILAVACLLLLIIGLVSYSKVTIAGEKVKRNTSYLTLYDKSLSAEDMNVINKMNKLESISFENCTIEGGLYALCKEDVWSLKLKNCGVTDNQMEGLDFTNMPNLSVLDVSGNSITELNGIEGLSNTLTYISISDTVINDLEFLGTFSNLREVYADNLGITSLEPLKHNKKLETLSVNGNELTSLKGIEECLELKYIYAGYNQLTSLEELGNATQLTEVYFNHNQISDFSVLSKSVAQLRTVYIDDNSVSDIGFLNGCTQLEYFGADNNQISDISILGTNPGMKEVLLENNQLTTLSGLENCEKLTYLDVSGNQISDTNALSSIPLQGTYGTTVDLSNNRITNLSLPAEGDYKLLNLRGNAITNMDVLAQSEIDNFAFDYNEALDFESVSKLNVVAHYLIMNCPLDKQVNLSQTLGYKASFCTEEELLDITSGYYSSKEKVIYDPK